MALFETVLPSALTIQDNTQNLQKGPEKNNLYFTNKQMRFFVLIVRHLLIFGNENLRFACAKISIAKEQIPTFRIAIYNIFKILLFLGACSCSVML